MSAWKEARAAHIAAAQGTEAGRVKRPGGILIGRLIAVRESYVRESHRIGPRTYTRIGWQVVPETRQMRRAQDRREDKQ